jgi:GH15 family glucan-1,4-alpha-glucosidase
MSDTGHYTPIADYGLIGDMHSCALVSKTGSIDWCCLPSFDSPSTFGRLLDWRRGGYFQVAPRGIQSISRRYLPRTNVLETTFTTVTGVAQLTDFMPIHPPSHSRILLGSGRRGADPHVSHRLKHPRMGEITPSFTLLGADVTEPFEVRFDEKVIRVLECVSGSIEFEMVCSPRFDYGTILPRTALDGTSAVHGLAHGGANALLVYCSAPMKIEEFNFVAQGRLGSGERLYAAVASLAHYTTDFTAADAWVSPEEIEHLLSRTISYWEKWSNGCRAQGKYADDMLRSALALKALVYEPSGAILAAATTSLPEGLGGERNWDYRFTWIRDASFSLKAFSDLGLMEEAHGFKDWLEWTTAYPEDLQLMYGIRGERRLDERLLPLEGYYWSKPVRIGNGAAEQFQLDIYGELLDLAYFHSQLHGELPDPEYRGLLRDVVEFAAQNWRRPDAGIWESRGGYRHFVYSKVQCWTALDRGVRLGEDVLKVQPHAALQADVERWKAVRQEIKDEVLSVGFDPKLGAFVQSYGSRTLDAAALMLPLVGFIDANDPRMRSTIEAIERDLTSAEGLVYRYRGFDDGLAGGEGTFIICSFWMVQNLALIGEVAKARSLLETLRGYANDLGLFSEEYDTKTNEMLGNFPQAFSHLAFIQSAWLLHEIEQRTHKDGEG